MNSSPSLAKNPASGGPAESIPLSLPFPYYSVASTPGTHAVIMEGFTEAIPSGLESRSEGNDRERNARASGFQEGQAEVRKGFEEQLGQARSSIADALSQFSRDRSSYFEKVEGEVVQLALSIAAKIMHREAQLDPMLLAGIVRVALEKIEHGTGVVLRVHPQKASEWQRYFAIHMRPEDVPEIVEDASQGCAQCVLQTAMGTATIGMEVQLKEIEQGLMDLLAARPGAGR
jgi:flagellar assembly protein FliH